MRDVVTLVGAQFGSEGKGLVAAAVAREFGCHIRVGGPNAGHTYLEPTTGTLMVAQSLPVGWINPDAVLIIGPGAILDVEQLAKEVAAVRHIDPTVEERLVVDPRAWVLSHADRTDEGGVNGAAHRLIGSTGKGVGAARIRKLDRGVSPLFFPPERVPDALDRVGLSGVMVEHVDGRNGHVRTTRHARILIEGTQGSGLSVTTGPWPHVTTEDTNSAGLLASCGISPGRFSHCILVARTFPIRVAGPSGPMKDETSWESVGQPPERTTVTKKIRRIGEFDRAAFLEAWRLNSPVVPVLTFADYIDDAVGGVTSYERVRDQFLDKTSRLGAWGARHWPDLATEAPDAFGTGPRTLAANLHSLVWGPE